MQCVIKTKLKGWVCVCVCACACVCAWLRDIGLDYWADFMPSFFNPFCKIHSLCSYYAPINVFVLLHYSWLGNHSYHTHARLVLWTHDSGDLTKPNVKSLFWGEPIMSKPHAPTLEVRWCIDRCIVLSSTQPISSIQHSPFFNTAHLPAHLFSSSMYSIWENMA